MFGIELIDATLAPAMFVALLSGILSFLSPCILPIVPPYLAYISGISLQDMSTTGAKGRSPIGAALFFVMGLSTVFLLLGFTASVFGRFFLSHAESFNLISGMVVMVFGLHFLGILRLGFIERDLRLEGGDHGGSLMGAYLLGLAFAFGWTPCIGPQLGTILTLAASEHSLARGTILLGVYGRKKINLNGSRVIDAYESGDRMFDIVPGYGRLPEDSFEQTNAFGAVYRGIDGRIAGVGTMMDICAHDVVVDGKLLAVVAKGQKRFKVLRVAQTEPYVIVDAVPIEDDAGADDAAAKKVDAVNAAGVMDVMTTLNKVDPYYMEAIGLTDFSKDDLKDMNEFDLANIMLYTHPTLALKLLAMTDATKRKDVVGAAAKGVLTSLNLGFTPRKSRLLFSFVNLGVLFGIGFVLLSLRQM